MSKDKKYNPVAIQEGIIWLVIIGISVISTVVLAIYNFFQHL